MAVLDLDGVVTWRLPLRCQTSPWMAMRPSCRGPFEASLSHELSHGGRWQPSGLQVCLRLKIGRSAVRPRPWPPRADEPRTARDPGYCSGPPAFPQVSDPAKASRTSFGPSALTVGAGGAVEPSASDGAGLVTDWSRRFCVSISAFSWIVSARPRAGTPRAEPHTARSTTGQPPTKFNRSRYS